MKLGRLDKILMFGTALMIALLVLAPTWYEYNVITDLADTDEFLIHDVSEASGDRSANIIWSALKTEIDVDGGFSLVAGDTYTGTHDFSGGTATFAANEIGASEISTVVVSAYWLAAGISADGTQCADAAQAVINSGPEIYTIICADNDASQIEGHIQMPDSWDGGTVVFELDILQTAADTAVFNSDVSVQARGATEAVNNTFGTEVAMDDAAVTGSNAIDQVTSGAVTPNCTTSCVGGDTLFWRLEFDAAGTTTGVTTLHILGMKMEYTSNVGD